MRQSPISYFAYALLLSSVLLFMPATAQAQRKNIVEQPKDSIRLFQGVQVSYDLVGTIMRMASDYGQYEGTVKFNLKNKFFPTFEMGYGTGEHDTDELSTIHAKTKAPYFKVGMDYNLAKNKNDGYRILAGFRYAFTKFDFEWDANPKDPAWGGTQGITIKEEGCNCHWAEFLVGVDAKIWGPLHLGWSVRYHLKLSTKEGEHGNVWYIPGYGKRSNTIGGTFNVGFEF